MRDCRQGLMSKTTILAATLLYPIIAIGVVGAGIYSLYWSVTANYGILFSLGCFCACSCLSIWIIRLSINCYRFETRKYQLSTKGVAIIGKDRCEINWCDINSIVIVAFGASGSRQTYETVVCFMLKPYDNRFLKGMLRSYLYGVNHMNEFLVVDHSLALVEELRSSYSQTIYDYRDKQLQSF